MIFDLVIIILFVMSLYIGFRRGLIAGVFDLIGWTLAALLAWRLYIPTGHWLGNHLQVDKMLDAVIGFILVFFVSNSVWNIISPPLVRLFPRPIRASQINHWLGIFSGGIYGLIYIGIAAWFIGQYPLPAIQTELAASRIAPPLESFVNRHLVAANSVFGTAIEDAQTVHLSSTDIGEIKNLNISYKVLNIDEKDEQRLISLLNDERVKRDLKPLTYSADLQNVARKHAEDMWKRQYFSHTDPDGLSPFNRLARAKVFYISAGENLALAPSADLAHQGLMNSPGHRDNILYPGFGKIGIGAVDAGTGRGIMFVQMFTN